MSKKFYALFLPLISLSLLSCSKGNKEGDAPINVVVSCYSLYDFATRIGGDRVSVFNLIANGSEPHDYEPTPRDLGKMIDADALFVNGLGLESWTDFSSGMGTQEMKRLQKKTHFIGESEGVLIEKVDGVIDPHLWLNLDNAVVEMGAIASLLEEIDPDHAATYAANLKQATSDFAALDQKVKEASKHWPSPYMVVGHAAFGYFANAYGLKQVYLHGLKPGDEPSASHIEEVIALVKEEGIPAIFDEGNESDAAVEKIASETGCEIKKLWSLESVSPRQLAGQDFLSLYEQNVKTLMGEQV